MSVIEQRAYYHRGNEELTANARECTRLVISIDVRQQSEAHSRMLPVCNLVSVEKFAVWGWCSDGWRGVRCGVREIGRQRSLFRLATLCYADYRRFILSFGELLRSRFTPPYPACCY